MQVLTTKLYIPQPRVKVIQRPRLFALLDKGLRRASTATLVSAPAGFGKTTLVAAWAARSGLPTAWLSLDEGDNDPVRFLASLVAAFRTIDSTVGEQAAGALSAASFQHPPIESILVTLFNEIDQIQRDVILVLDDYQVMDAKVINTALGSLLQRLPENLHLMILTREDPDIPVARLRAQNQLLELRIADLRFSPSESREFLNQLMKLNLTEEDIAALESRTEGWIAGLQLAALSLQGNKDNTGFIKSFTGSHRFVMDYLIEEVLHRQSKNIQDFLLRTSILDRLCAPLCDAVLQDPAISSRETLEYLERANLFIIPLDDEGRWYRFHRLFADLLTNQLARAFPDQISALHSRASDWCANNGLPEKAITHRLLIQDWNRAAELIELNSRSMWLRGDIGILLSWLEALPAGFRLERTRLGVVYAWTLVLDNQLDRAERLLDQMPTGAGSAPELEGELLAVRVLIAAYRSDMPSVIELAQRSLASIPADDLFLRSTIMLSLGIAYDDMSGNITSAKDAYRKAYELGKAFSHSNAPEKNPSALIALVYLAELEWQQGNLRKASQMYAESLDLAGEWGGQVSQARAQWGVASLLYEWNDLNGAMKALEESVRSGELWRNPRDLVHSYGLSAWVMQTLGQTEEARVMIHRAEQVTRESYSSPPTLGSLALYQIILWTSQKDFESITRWEQEHDADWQSQIGRVRDILAYVFARAQIARFFHLGDDTALEAARGLIEFARERARATGFMYNTVRLDILDALRLYAKGDAQPAVITLKRALTVAESENHVRSFLDMGKPMEELLLWAAKGRSLGGPSLRSYVTSLIAQFAENRAAAASQPANQSAIEALTERELDVLRLIARGLTNREISRQLFLALDTVKNHNRRIFSKLQVQRRTEAVARARELRLI